MFSSLSHIYATKLIKKILIVSFFIKLVIIFCILSRKFLILVIFCIQILFLLVKPDKQRELWYLSSHLASASKSRLHNLYNRYAHARVLTVFQFSKCRSVYPLSISKLCVISSYGRCRWSEGEKSSFICVSSIKQKLRIEQAQTLHRKNAS